MGSIGYVRGLLELCRVGPLAFHLQDVLLHTHVLCDTALDLWRMYEGGVHSVVALTVIWPVVCIQSIRHLKLELKLGNP